MTTCLLCPAPPVADGLCVPDAARLWAAKAELDNPTRARLIRETSATVVHMAPPIAFERIKAMREIDTPDKARAFLARLDAARAEQHAKTCGRPGCRKCHEER